MQIIFTIHFHGHAFSVALLVSVRFAGMWTQIKTSSCNYDFHEVTVKLLHEAFLEIIQLSLETLSHRIQTTAVSGQLCLDTFWNFSEVVRQGAVYLPYLLEYSGRISLTTSW